MERDQQGYSTTNGLFAIISTLGRLPGRKSLVLFSEGLAIPPAVAAAVPRRHRRRQPRQRQHLHHGRRRPARRERAGEDPRPGESSAGGAGDGGYLGASGGGAPLVRRRSRRTRTCCARIRTTRLGKLAQDTGGLLFDNTQQPAAGLRSRRERSAQLLPPRLHADQRARSTAASATIEVKVKRSGRHGRGAEGLLRRPRRRRRRRSTRGKRRRLARSSRSRCRTPFPVRAGALLFPERDRPGLVPVVVDLKTAPLTFQPAADGKTYTSDFAVLVRFLDRENQVVRKVSQHYEVNGPICADSSARSRARCSSIASPSCPPASTRWRPSSTTRRPANRACGLSTVEVPQRRCRQLRMSSLVLVKRGEKVPEKDRRADNPLLVKDVVLYPESRRAGQQGVEGGGVLLRRLSRRGQGRRPKCAIELLQNGKPVAQLPMPLPPADASGRIQQVGRLPLDQLAPGTYELRAIVKQGERAGLPARRCCGSWNDELELRAGSSDAGLAPRAGGRAVTLSSLAVLGWLSALPLRCAVVRAAAPIANPSRRRPPRSSSTSSCATGKGRPVTDLDGRRLRGRRGRRRAEGRHLHAACRTAAASASASRGDRRRARPSCDADGQRAPATAPPTRRRTMRRRRWCSITCRPSRCGWRSGPRSTTCR